MKWLASLILVVGFCVGTLGAAGFHSPRLSAGSAGDEHAATEARAWPLFVGGLAALVAGGLLARFAARTASAAAGSGRAGVAKECRALVTGICAKVGALDARAGELGCDGLKQEIDALLSGEYFDLVSRHAELTRAIGFSEYARVWEGVADAERNLARAWSTATDGHADEARAALGLARAAIESSERAFGTLAR